MDVFGCFYIGQRKYADFPPAYLISIQLTKAFNSRDSRLHRPYTLLREPLSNGTSKPFFSLSEFKTALLKKHQQFLLQIVSLTLAPAYYAAGIYLCLSRLVTIYDSSISRLRPINYTRLFIGCDIISLSLQGAGGGLASTSASDNQPTTTGNNVMIAGLGFQVLTLGLFMVLSAEFAFRVYKGDKSSRNPLYVDLRSRKRFKAFIGALILSTTCIMIRSIYRLIEMSQGWSGTLQKNETYFFILEGVMVIIAVGALLLHPGWCLMGAYQAKEKGDVDIEMKMRDSEDRI